MKQLLVTGLFTFILSFSWAQVIGIYQDGYPVDVSGTVVDLAGGEETEEYFEIVNESSATYMLRVERVKLQTVAGATDSLCWGKEETSAICYPSAMVGSNDDWTSPDSYSWVALDTGVLSVYHVANGNLGVALYRYYIIDDSGDKLDSVDVRFTSTVSIQETVQERLHAYPNPATDKLFVEVKSQEDALLSIKVFNLMGAQVLEGNLKDGVNEFDVSGQGSGVYFYSLYRNGVKLKTRKLIIK